MKIRKRFAADWAMNEIDVDTLARLADQAHYCNEKACNGDVIFVGRTKITDKNEAARLWEAKVDETVQAIERLVTPHGFTAVVFTGLRPCLKRGEQFVDIPE